MFSCAMIKKIFLGLALLFIALQFVRPAKNLSPVPGPQDITAKVTVPAGVQQVFAKACYDCHSDHTRYPWYAGVQPVGWWLSSHIHDGKQHLNFSEFGTYKAKTADRKLKQIAREVDDGSMPLNSYTLIHRDAILTAAEIKLIDDWVEAARTQIAPKETEK
jgi:mono/diheme cytochrome c family protein